MTLIYLVADREKPSDRAICVRTEVMRSGDSVVFYRWYKTKSFAKAKLQALKECLEHVGLPRSESLTVFPDDQRIVREWEEIGEGWNPEKHVNEWNALCAELGRFRLKPQMRAGSCLTVAMRSDLKIFLAGRSQLGGC